MVIRHKFSKRYRRQILYVGWAAVVGGAYVLSTSFSPVLLYGTPSPAEVEPITKEMAAAPVSKENRLSIPKLDLRVPIVEGADESALEKGAWHRFPQRGDPVAGGNFIVSAHRFLLGLTPQGTKSKSPFYHLDKLQVGDEFFVDWEGKRYVYAVSGRYSVKPDEVSIEAPVSQARMTLYSCTLKGSRDGRYVVEAVLKSDRE